jgi:hypothetical protein
MRKYPFICSRCLRYTRSENLTENYIFVSEAAKDYEIECVCSKCDLRQSVFVNKPTIRVPRIPFPGYCAEANKEKHIPTSSIQAPSPT